MRFQSGITGFQTERDCFSDQFTNFAIDLNPLKSYIVSTLSGSASLAPPNLSDSRFAVYRQRSVAVRIESTVEVITRA